jgi:uncharacterized coiled-coil protein SlyX
MKPLILKKILTLIMILTFSLNAQANVYANRDRVIETITKLQKEVKQQEFQLNELEKLLRASTKRITRGQVRVALGMGMGIGGMLGLTSEVLFKLNNGIKPRKIALIAAGILIGTGIVLVRNSVIELSFAEDEYELVKENFVKARTYYYQKKSTLDRLVEKFDVVVDLTGEDQEEKKGIFILMEE